MKHITFRHTLIISFILHVLMIGAFFMSHFLHTYIPRLTPQQLHNPDEKSDPRKDTETALPIDEESALSFSFQDGDIQDTIGTPQENNTASEVIEEKKTITSEPHTTPLALSQQIFNSTKKFVDQYSNQKAILVQSRQKQTVQKHLADMKELSYKDRIKQHLAERWHSFVHSQKGTPLTQPIRATQFTYTIAQNGAIASFTIVQSSGNQAFDQLVKTFLYNYAAPFPRIPQALGVTEYTPTGLMDFVFPT